MSIWFYSRMCKCSSVLGVWWIWECGEEEAFDDCGVARHRILWGFAGTTTHRRSGWETSRITTFIFYVLYVIKYTVVWEILHNIIKVQLFQQTLIKERIGCFMWFHSFFNAQCFLSPLRCRVYHHLVSKQQLPNDS